MTRAFLRNKHMSPRPEITAMSPPVTTSEQPALRRPATYQICTRTVMDTSDRLITFDGNGISNHWHAYHEAVARQHEDSSTVESLAERIRHDGRRRTFDCIVGVSGGVDSTYVAFLAKKHGLRPLAVHFDNGWNDELAVSNIEKTINALKFDLETYVVNWSEFRDIQLAYFRASVVDIEAITDHAILATLYRTAARHRVKWILSGTNVVTEAILPRDWIWGKDDATNIRAIHDAHGKVPLKTFPLMNMARLAFYRRALGINMVSFLDKVEYVKADAIEILRRELAWRDYGGKHYESIFTRFYQGFILPTKFHFDKRRAHLSALICGNQLRREEALEILQASPYPSPSRLESDRDFVLKKLGISRAEFDTYLASPRREHSQYRVQGKTIYDEYPLLGLARPLRRLFR